MATLPSKNALNDLAGGYYSYWTDGTTEGRATVAVLLGSTDAQAAAASFSSLALGTPLSAANGGTGLTSISTLLNSNVTPATLGLVIGTNVQEYSVNLDALAADPLTASTAASTYLTQASAASTYLTQATAASTYLTIATAASTYQPLDADLTAIAALSSADGNFIVGSATGWVAESGATARTSLGLGSSNSPTFAGLTVTNRGVFGNTGSLVLAAPSGTINGITAGGGTVGRIHLSGSLQSDIIFEDNSATAGKKVFQLRNDGGEFTLRRLSDDGLTGTNLYVVDSSNVHNFTGAAVFSSTLSAGATTVTGTLGAGAATFSGVTGTTLLTVLGSDTNGNADMQIKSTGTTGNSRLYFADTAGSLGSIIYSHAANSLVLGANGATALTIDSSQNATFAGKVNTSASTTTRASLNIPSGTAPTSPTNGDIWSDGSDILVRLGGTTYTLTKA